MRVRVVRACVCVLRACVRVLCVRVLCVCVCVFLGAGALALARCKVPSCGPLSVAHLGFGSLLLVLPFVAGPFSLPVV
jgi:hypothetical protein